ncbi:MAG TPA: 6-phosphogluconolactonase [Pirellulales bacterium]
MTAACDLNDRIFESAESLARGTADWLCERAAAAGDSFAVCCSGGSTPRRLYELMAQPPVLTAFPWSHVHWFWGDERFVPHDHPNSNYGMMRAALLSKAPIPAGNVHPVPIEGMTPQQSATAYEKTLRHYYGADDLDAARPLFDVTFLGIGDDGHTASLLPGQPALEETRRWVVAVPSGRSEPRVTLTYPVLDSSRDVAFLAVGHRKRDVVAKARSGDRNLPAGRIEPVGRLHWFVDGGAGWESKA